MFRSAQLGAAHDLSAFASGEDPLDSWLTQHALRLQAKGISRTFVWLDSDVVVGYYALAAHQILRDTLPRSYGRGDPQAVPAVLLGKLALDKTLHGQGLGAALLADALARVVEATRSVAARYVVVDALHDRAAEFYAHHGFVGQEGSSRLFRKIADIGSDVGR